jgi:lipoprotein-releasing system permease protein
MTKPFEFFIGLRYIRAKRRNHFISFITFASMLGVAVGVMALITVLSVMNGFELELRERILGIVSHATVTAADDRLNDWRSLTKRLEGYPHIVGLAPYVSAEGMLSNGDQVSGTLIRGILPGEERSVSNLDDKMVAGHLSDLRPGGFGIILGKELAVRLGVAVGDKVTMITPETNVTPVGILPRIKRFTVVGLFEAGMYEYDSALCLIHLDDAQKLFQMKSAVSGVRIKLDNMFLAPSVTRQLVQDLPPGYMITDWTRQHANFFRAVETEKTTMFIILSLIVGVAAFNIISTLIMVVTDKQADIAILRTIGATPTSIMTIFIILGTVIGVIGTLLGAAGGIALATNVEVIVPAIERLFGIHFLSPEVYYISEVPSQLRVHDVVVITTVAFVLCVLATIYPARRAAQTQPAEALRHE